jgi:hypothetical protein
MHQLRISSGSVRIYCTQLVTLYRGLSASHKDFAKGKKGVVEPATVLQSQESDWNALFDMAATHNLASRKTDSPFTSWTRTLEVAKQHAGDSGIVLTATVGNQITKCFPSPDEWNEDEVLVLGKVTDCVVLPISEKNLTKEV